MPYIDAKFSVKVDEKQMTPLAKVITNSITAIPGKTPQYVMVNIEDNCNLFFRGEETPCAMFEVKLLGASTKSAYQALTAKLCEIAQTELGIEGKDVYVKFDEVENWGMDSFMF